MRRCLTTSFGGDVKLGSGDMAQLVLPNQRRSRGYKAVHPRRPGSISKTKILSFMVPVKVELFCSQSKVYWKGCTTIIVSVVYLGVEGGGAGMHV